MVAKVLSDTSNDKVGHRQKIYKEGNTTAYTYSSGHEIVVEKAGEGIPGKLKEVREIRRISSPKVRVSIPYKDGDYERIFRKDAAQSGATEGKS